MFNGFFWYALGRFLRLFDAWLAYSIGWVISNTMLTLLGIFFLLRYLDCIMLICMFLRNSYEREIDRMVGEVTDDVNGDI